MVFTVERDLNREKFDYDAQLVKYLTQLPPNALEATAG